MEPENSDYVDILITQNTPTSCAQKIVVHSIYGDCRANDDWYVHELRIRARLMYVGRQPGKLITNAHETRQSPRTGLPLILREAATADVDSQLDGTWRALRLPLYATDQ